MTLTEEQRGTVAFDLEKARAICEAATKADFIFQDEQPDGDEDGWDGGYYKTGEILIIRDKNDDAAAPESIGQLDRQGDAEFFCQAITLFPDALDEIERLRASLIDLHAEYINTLEKNPDCSAWDLDEQSDADQRRLRRNAAHAISITEPPIYIQAEQLAARIKELEDALVEERARVITSHPLTHVIDEDRTEASMQLQAEGKIGPDATKPQSWQITEERKAAIDRGLQFLEWSYAKNSAHDTKEQIAVLWAMLEASQ